MDFGFTGFTQIDWLPALGFVLVTALAPGPNSLSSASMGVLYGYKRTVQYILGMSAGIFLMSMIAGGIADFILELVPAYEAILRYIGAAYVLLLAYKTLQATYTERDEDVEPMGFKAGFLLQFLNVKMILFSLTFYASYLQPLIGKWGSMALVAFGLAARGFLLFSLWAIFGESIRRLLRRPLVGRIFNIGVAGLLVYNAADLLGIPPLLKAFFT